MAMHPARQAYVEEAAPEVSFICPISTHNDSYLCSESIHQCHSEFAHGILRFMADV